MYQDRKKELLEKIKNLQLMDNYYANKEKMNNPIGSTIGLGKNIYNGLKSMNSTPQPSADFMSKIGASAPQGATFNTPANSINGLGSTSLNTQAMPTNTIGAAEGASQATGALSKAGDIASKAGNAMSKAAPVLGAISAGNNFAKGDTVNGALDLAKTGAMFIPGVGWIASAAIQIGQMLKNAFDKKRQETMAKGQEEAAKAQQQALQAYDQQHQGYDELKQENQQKIQQQMDNMNQPQQDNTALVQELMNDYKATGTQPEGQVTGGAASIMPTNYAEESMPTMTPEELALIEQQGQPQQSAQQDVKQSLMDKLRSGLNDFSAGYQDNANTDFAHGDLMNGIVTGGAAPVQTSNNSFNLGAEATKKGLMARLGELAGTGQRIMAHPLTQAAIAGGISKAAGGDIDDIAKAAYQYGTAKANADRYYQQVTGKTNRPFLNTYSATDVTNKRLEDALAQRQQQWQESQRYKQQKDQRDYDYKVNKDKEDRQIKREELNARKEYYKSRGNNAQLERLAYQRQKDAIERQLKLAKQEYDNTAKMLKESDDYGTREEQYKGLFGNQKTRQVPITKEEAMQEALDKYNQKIKAILGGGSAPASVEDEGWDF